MLYGEYLFLKSTGMSKDELYSKVAKLKLLGVDFNLDTYYNLAGKTPNL